ncbi:MarR family transcriptional regulator [Arthrobacter sp. MYb23]|uniref:MarR family winged helix-turn-helix transcriptional regulator n=1 Tax=unclassified Arthrobacter TaxID=235627 RepID=UPI000CFB5829|nr:MULTISPECIES: MarR family transcriptional regulator [unclassified Arthrobacter]PRB43445.1 MarR family transcriptional regulator [Arthrobacter sp. MYb51]PRB93689.1 MarR family transcriptional regulator [Arthrobacter sp. MYb23]
MIPETAAESATADETFRMTADARKMKRIGSSDYESLAQAAAIELYPDVNSPAMALCFNLIRAANRMTTDMEVSVHRPMGISFAGYRLLFTIKSVGQVNPNELARLSSVSTASIASLLNTLEKSGLVTREPDPEDKRKTVVQLSAEGEQLLAELFQINNQREQAWADGLTETEASILAQLLRKLLLHHPAPRTN